MFEIIFVDHVFQFEFEHKLLLSLENTMSEFKNTLSESESGFELEVELSMNTSHGKVDLYLELVSMHI